MTTLKITWSLVIAGSLVSAACGDSKSSMNPVAPSAVVIGAQNDEPGDGVSTTTGKPTNPGNGNGNGNDGDNDRGKGKDKQPNVPSGPQPPTNGSPGAPGQKKVEIEGLISAKSGDTITVNSQTVVVPPTCPIRHGQARFTFDDLNIGDRVHVRAARTTIAGVLPTTSLEATEVILQNPGDGEGSGDDTPTDLVSVTASDAFASEIAGDTGTFTLTRSGSATLLAAALTVNYTVGGSAVSGADYTALAGTATFAPGVATTTVVVTPVADATTEGAETVSLTLTTAAPYDLGSPAVAVVTITDTNLPLVTVAAFDSTATEATSDPGRFRFTRTGSTASSLTVTFTVAGTATGGTDYQALPVSVTIPAGAAFADVFVMPLADGDNAEVAETVIVTVTDGAAYDLAATSTATVTIAP